MDVSNHLIEKGCAGLIAGCTEIPLVLDQEDVAVPLFDPLLILARAAVREARQ
jgi:aspartate racemase